MVGSTRRELKFELKDMKPEEVIAGFKAARAESTAVMTARRCLEGDDTVDTFEFGWRLKCNDDRTALIAWVKENFGDILAAGTDKIEFILETYTARALVMLGYIYWFGLGVEQDDKIAVRYFFTAANKNDLVGIHALGVCYHHGFAVIKDPIKARELYQRASELGFVSATCSLSLLIEREFPAEQSLAFFYSCQAAEKGNSSALCNLGMKFNQGTSHVMCDAYLARLFFAASALKGNILSLYRYGLLLNENEQWKFIRLAAQYGEENALNECQKEFDSKDAKQSFTVSYHVALAPKKTAKPEQLARWHTTFFNLCETQPDEVKRLTGELGDTGDEILSGIAEDKRYYQTQVMCLVLTLPALRMMDRKMMEIVLVYMSFFMPYVLEKEKEARICGEILKTSGSCPARLFKRLEAADRREITFQEVMRNAFQ